MHRADKGILLVVLAIAGFVIAIIMTPSSGGGPGAFPDFIAMFVGIGVSLLLLALLISGLYLMFSSPPKKR